MALDPKRKAACKAAILDHLDHAGPREWNAVRSAFPDVPHATFWRLVRDVKAEAMASKVQAAPPGDDQDAVQGAIIDKTLDEGRRVIAQTLREPPRVRDLLGQDAIDPRAVLADCLANARAVIDHAQPDGGRVRQPKLLLAASRLMADVLRTAAAVSETLLEEGRIRDFYRMIMEEIAAESPACAARIAARLEALNARAGLVSVMGQ